MTTPTAPDRRRFLTGLLGSAVALTTLPAIARKHRRVVIQHSPLAGFQFHNGEALWSRLRIGDVLTLVREPDNPYDARAVRVDWHGHPLGYVPRRENTAVAQMLDRKQMIGAQIRQLRQGNDPWARVELEITLAA